MGLVAKAKPDGYTLLLALSSISILPEADKVLGTRAAVPARPVRADRPAYRRSDRARRARRQPVEDVAGFRRRCEASGRARSRTDRPATTERCTCRWRCSRTARTSSCCTFPSPAAGPRVIALLGGQVDALSHRSIDRIAAREGREGARARVVGRSSPCVAAPSEDADRIGLRRRLLPVVGVVRARGNAGADCCAPARSGACRGRRFAVRQHAGDRRDAGSVSRCAGNATLLGSGRRGSWPTPCSA